MGNVDQDRPLTAGIGDMEGLLDDSGNVGSPADDITEFDKGFAGAGNIRLLEHVAAHQPAVDLPGNAYHGNTVGKSGGDARDQVGRAGAAGHSRHAGLAAGPGIAAGRVARALFMTDQDRMDLTVQHGVEERSDGNARIAEHILHVLFFQTSDERVRAGNNFSQHNSVLFVC